MRRIIGAAVLFAAIVMPRAGQLLRISDRSDFGVDRIRSGAPLAPVDTAGNVRAPAATRRTPDIPDAYLAAPLEFLSNAPVDSLVLLPGIGPVIAERIANARSGKRSFTRWEDLLEIKGVGPKKLDRLKQLADAANGF